MPPVRLLQQQQATASGAGAATFTFQAVPEGLAWTGTVGIPNAPTSSVFTAQVGVPSTGTTWGAWTGNATFGPIQCYGRETLVIIATGLAAGITYSASFIGQSEFENDSLPVSPTALATAVSSSSVSPTNGAVTTSVATSEALANTSYTALATAMTVSVTPTTSGLLLVEVSAFVAGGGSAVVDNFYMSFALSGGNTLAASDANALVAGGFVTTSAGGLRATASTTLTGLANAATTVTALFRTAAGNSCAWSNRKLAAIPL